MIKSEVKNVDKNMNKKILNDPNKPNKGIITIRLKKGLIACNPVQRATVRGLGLKSREQVRSLENTPSVRGMIKKVLHLVEIISETRV